MFFLLKYYLYLFYIKYYTFKFVSLCGCIVPETKANPNKDLFSTFYFILLYVIGTMTYNFFSIGT